MATVLDFNQFARQDENTSRQLSYSEVVEAFQSAIEAHGFGRPIIEADSKLHRFDLPDEKRGRESGWYILHPDNIPSGAFGSWKHDLSFDWCSKANYELTQSEIEFVRERARNAQQERETARVRLAEEAAAKAFDILSKGNPDCSGNPYLARKKLVATDGVRVDTRGNLLIPMYDCFAQVRGLQRIAPDGTKRFIQGQATVGLFHAIQSPSSASPRTVIVCEGYATGASIHMADPSWVVMVAFNAGNLKAVAQAAKELFPDANLIIAADNDQWTRRPDGTPHNVGVEKGREAATEVGARCVHPAFLDTTTKPTDYNDLHIIEGLDAVRRQIKGYQIRLDDWSLGALSGSTPPVREWLVEDVLPLGIALVMAAPGGLGKGILTLDLALKVASDVDARFDQSQDVFGHPVVAHGPVVMLAAEDDRDEIHRRAASLCGSFPARLFCLTLPDMAGAHAIAVSDRDGVKFTPFWIELEEQILHLRPKLLVIDPIACFAHADLNDRNTGAVIMARLSNLAKRSNCTVLVIHHMNKLKDGIKTPEQARNAITGTAGFVDHGRGAIALWPEEDAKCKRICADLGLEYRRNRVVLGALVKANYPGDQEIKTYVRNDVGLLVPLDQEAKEQRANEYVRLLGKLVQAIREAAEQGHPFEHTGKAGLYEMRERLPHEFRALGKHTLNAMGRRLLDDKRIGKYAPASGGKSEKWLDVPTGPFARGEGELERGGYDLGNS